MLIYKEVITNENHSYYGVDCELLTDKQRHNRNCNYVETINGYDIYVLGEKYYYCSEND